MSVVNKHKGTEGGLCFMSLKRSNSAVFLRTSVVLTLGHTEQEDTGFGLNVSNTQAKTNVMAS